MEPDKNPSTTNPTAAYELKMMELEGSKPIADRVPLLRKSALIVLALICLAFVTQFGSIMVEKSMGALPSSVLGEYFRRHGIISLLLLVAQTGAIFTLLFTRSVQIAKIILVAAGVSFICSFMMELVHFNIIGMAIDAFIVWRIYELHESL